MVEVRNATLKDAKDILKIYDYYTKNTAITFDIETPSLKEFKNKMKHIMAHYPYLVITEDGVIKGYSYAGPFVGRGAYKYSVETTIYISPEAKGKGYGRMIYQALEERLKPLGIINLYACIGHAEVEDEYLVNNSERFHAHMGYKQVAEFYKCGYKFNRWYTMIWMGKQIANIE